MFALNWCVIISPVFKLVFASRAFPFVKGLKLQLTHNYLLNSCKPGKASFIRVCSSVYRALVIMGTPEDVIDSVSLFWIKRLNQYYNRCFAKGIFVIIGSISQLKFTRPTETKRAALIRIFG